MFFHSHFIVVFHILDRYEKEAQSLEEITLNMSALLRMIALVL